MMKPGVSGWAEFSEDRRLPGVPSSTWKSGVFPDSDPWPRPRCRFALGRDWDKSKGVALFTGLNPSRAGADIDDMTVTKGIGFARAWGLGGTIHVNAFPFITPYPDLLKQCTVDEMARNDRRLVELARTAKVVVLAWGSFPAFKERFWKVARLLAPFHPICLGRTSDGYPKHISRIAYATPREPWKPSRPEKSQSYPGQAVCEKCKQCWCACA